MSVCFNIFALQFYRIHGKASLRQRRKFILWKLLRIELFYSQTSDYLTCWDTRVGPQAVDCVCCIENLSWKSMNNSNANQFKHPPLLWRWKRRWELHDKQKYMSSITHRAHRFVHSWWFVSVFIWKLKIIRKCFSIESLH